MVLKWLGSSCHCHQSGSGFGDPLLPLSLPSVPRASPSHGKPVCFVVGGGRGRVLAPKLCVFPSDAAEGQGNNVL